MSNYAKAMARDKGGEAMQNSPAPNLALARSGAENGTASSVLTLTDNTTVIEVSAQGVSAALRWIPATETAAVSPFASIITAVSGVNYDHIIPSGTVRRFVVPIETMPSASVVGANVQNGLYKRVAIKNIGVGSVLLAEY